MDFINFDSLTIAEMKTQLTQELLATQQLIKQLPNIQNSTWTTVMQPLQIQLGKLQHTWGIVEHLHSVKNEESLRELHEEFLPQITDLYVDIGQNTVLFKHVDTIEKSDNSLNIEQRKVIANELRDFKLSGINLPQTQQELFKDIQSKLSELTTKFEHNVLDATDDFSYFADKDDLVGIPEDVLSMYNAQAVADGESTKYKLTLHMPSYLPIMQYAKNRQLREKMYFSYVTRASELVSAGKYDNSAIIKEIIQLRQQKADLLGFANYAELSLATKMANSPAEVIDFLTQLATKARPFALADMEELRQIAKDKDGIVKLEAWDIPYYSEILQQTKYSYSSNELKQYFQLPNVLNGLFDLLGLLFNVKLMPKLDIPTWHQDVLTYEVLINNSTVGYLYFDLFARNGKQPGAWMNSARSRSFDNGEHYLPQAYIVCNFTAPIGDKPSLLSFDDVQTLFHEMGHGLHHLLTRINNSAIAGINGVEWDAVELPSQFMENFAWNYDILVTMTEHIETKAVLPKDLFDKVLASRYFQSGLMTLRQLEFAIFDMRLHNKNFANGVDYLQILAEVRNLIAVMIPPSYNRFANTFGHIFAGGYAAGYYSYKWAEVLSCDVFSIFEGKAGAELSQLGERYLDTILSQGGLYPMMANFEKFMGRKPSVEALLRYSGLVS